MNPDNHVTDPQVDKSQGESGTQSPEERQATSKDNSQTKIQEESGTKCQDESQTNSQEEPSQTPAQSGAPVTSEDNSQAKGDKPDWPTKDFEYPFLREEEHYQAAVDRMKHMTSEQLLLITNSITEHMLCIEAEHDQQADTAFDLEAIRIHKRTTLAEKKQADDDYRQEKERVAQEKEDAKLVAVADEFKKQLKLKGEKWNVFLTDIQKKRLSKGTLELLKKLHEPTFSIAFRKRQTAAIRAAARAANPGPGRIAYVQNEESTGFKRDEEVHYRRQRPRYQDPDVFERYKKADVLGQDVPPPEAPETNEKTTKTRKKREIENAPIIEDDAEVERHASGRVKRPTKDKKKHKNDLTEESSNENSTTEETPKRKRNATASGADSPAPKAKRQRTKKNIDDDSARSETEAQDEKKPVARPGFFPKSGKPRGRPKGSKTKKRTSKLKTVQNADSLADTGEAGEEVLFPGIAAQVAEPIDAVPEPPKKKHAGGRPRKNAKVGSAKVEQAAAVLEAVPEAPVEEVAFKAKPKNKGGRPPKTPATRRGGKAAGGRGRAARKEPAVLTAD